jgi:predicted phosphodiesterase
MRLAPTTRVAAIYDVHGNLPALEAVLDAIAMERVDRIVVGGDVTLGPMPCEVLDRLLDLDVPTSFVQGNCDIAVRAEMTGVRQGQGLPDGILETVRWTAAELAPEDQAVIARWPLTIRLPIDGLGEVLFCHATPRDANELFTKRTPQGNLVAIFDAAEAPVVVCGHTHMQFDRRVGKTRVVNAGSVGLPLGSTGAHWALLGPAVELRRTAYDLEAAARRIRATAYPHASKFARDILEPASESETLERFAKAEVKRP